MAVRSTSLGDVRDPAASDVHVPDFEAFGSFGVSEDCEDTDIPLKCMKLHFLMGLLRLLEPTCLSK